MKKIKHLFLLTALLLGLVTHVTASQGASVGAAMFAFSPMEATGLSSAPSDTPTTYTCVDDNLCDTYRVLFLGLSTECQTMLSALVPDNLTAWVDQGAGRVDNSVITVGPSGQVQVDVCWTAGYTGPRYIYIGSADHSAFCIGFIIELKASPVIPSIPSPFEVACGADTLALPAGIDYKNSTPSSEGWFLADGTTPATMQPRNFENGDELVYVIKSDCGDVVSDPVTIAITGEPSAGAIATDRPIACIGTAIKDVVTFTTSVDYGSTLAAQITEGWVLDGTNVNEDYVLTIADNGKPLSYYVATPWCGTVTSNTLTLSVKELPTIDVTGLPALLECNENGHEFKLTTEANCQEGAQVYFNITIVPATALDNVTIEYADGSNWKNLNQYFVNGVYYLPEGMSPGAISFQDDDLHFRLKNNNGTTTDVDFDITIDVVDGTKASILPATEVFTASVTVPGKPTVEVTDYPQTPFCVNAVDGGIAVKFTGEPDYTLVYKVDGTPATLTTSATTATIALSPTLTTGTHTVTFVSMTDGYNCPATTVPDAITINVNALPVVTITGDDAVCIGSSTTLLGMPPAGGIFTSSNTAVATITGGTVTPVAAGVTTITYTYTDTETGCTNSATHTLTVNQLPPVELNGDTEVCIGSVTLLTTNNTGSSWTSSNPAIATVASTAAKSAVVEGVAAGTATITVSYTDANGCTNSNSVTVSVKTLPLVDITPATLTTVCLNASATLTGNPAGGSWTSSNNGIATINNSGVITPVVAGAVTFTYSYEDNGCTGIATKAITINPLPEVTITSTVTGTCVNSSATLTATPITGGTWTTSAASVATIDNNGVITPVAAGAVTFTYSYRDGNGCIGSATQAFTIYPKPNPPTAGTPQVLCPVPVLPTSSALTATLMPGHTPKWYDANREALSATTPLQNAGTYYVTQISPEGCESDMSDDVEVRFTVWADSVVYCAGEYPPPALVADAYECNVGGGGIQGSITLSAGTYCPYDSINPRDGDSQWAITSSPAGTAAPVAEVTIAEKPGLRSYLNSNTLGAKQFDFSGANEIPSGALITRITVIVDRQGERNTPGWFFGNYRGIRDDQSNYGLTLTTGPGSYTHTFPMQGDNDEKTWANKRDTVRYVLNNPSPAYWSVDKINNNPDFGILYRVENTRELGGGDATAKIYNVSIQVEYEMDSGIEWYSDAAGNNQIAQGSIFDPTTTPGIDNVTPVDTTFYVACRDNLACILPVKYKVKDRPMVNDVASVEICPGQEVKVEFTSISTLTTGYEWVAGPATAAAAIGMNSTGSGDIEFTAENTTSDPIIVDVTVTPVGNQINDCPLISKNFTITVFPRPEEITITPDTMVCVNSSIVLSASTATSVTGEWKTSDAAVASLTAPVTASTVTLNGVAPGTATITYLYASTVTGCPDSTSLVITVNALPTITIDTVSVTACLNEPIRTKVTVENVGTTGVAYYTLLHLPAASSAGTGTFNVVDGENNLDIPNVLGAGIYTLHIDSLQNTETGCWAEVLPGQSDPIQVLDVVMPTVTVSDPYACQGTIINLAIDETTPTTANWYIWKGGVSIGLPDGEGSVLPSFEAVNLSDSIITATIVITPYYVQPATPGNPMVFLCTGDSTEVDITVYPSPRANIPLGMTYCHGQNVMPYLFNGPQDHQVEYHWRYVLGHYFGLQETSGVNEIPGFIAVNMGIAPLMAVYEVTATFTDTITGKTCVGQPLQFLITVNPKPIITKVADQVYCNNTNVPAYQFQSNRDDAVFVWHLLGGETNLPGIKDTIGNGAFPPFVATNTTEAPISARYVVEVHYEYANTVCGTAADTFKITINPTPIVPLQQADVILCNGESFSAIDFAAANPNFMYTWEQTGFNIGLSPMFGSGSIPEFVATNTTNQPIEGIFTVTPRTLDSLCTGTPMTFKVIVNPDVTVNVIADKYYYNGDRVEEFGFTGTAANYNWTSNGDPIGIAASGINVVPSFTAMNPGTTTLTSTIVVTPVSSACTGTATTVTTIYVLPRTIEDNDLYVEPIEPQTVCKGEDITPVDYEANHRLGTDVTGVTFETRLLSGEDVLLIGSAINTTMTGFGPSTYVNTTTAPVTGMYEVTPILNNSRGRAIVFSITVQPTPSVNNMLDIIVDNGVLVPATMFSGVATQYNWEAANNTATGVAASGFNQIPSFVAKNITPDTTMSVVTVTPIYGACTGTAGNFTIKVAPTIIPDNLNLYMEEINDQTVCSNATISAITFAAKHTTVDPLTDVTYKVVLVSGVNVLENATLDATGYSASSYVNTTNAPVSGHYKVTPYWHNFEGRSEEFTITVNPVPTVEVISPIVVKNGDMTPVIPFIGVGSEFRWTADNTATGIAGAGTGNIQPFKAINTTASAITATIMVTPYYLGCPGTETEVTTLVVKPWIIPDVENFGMTTIADQTICSGANTAAITFEPVHEFETIDPAEVTYVAVLVSGTDILGAPTATGYNAVPYVNTGIAPISGHYKVTPYWHNFEGRSVEFTITVNPVPTVNLIASQTWYNGDIVPGFGFTGNATSFEWTATHTEIGISGSGTNFVPGFKAVNTTSQDIVSTISVTPYYGACSVTPVEVTTITVKPKTITDIDNFRMLEIGNQTICSGGALTNEITFAAEFDNQADLTGIRYRVELINSTKNVLAGFEKIQDALANNIIGYEPASYTNTTSADIVSQYRVTPIWHNFEGKPWTFSVTVRPAVSVEVMADQTVYNGDFVNVITFTGKPAGANFAWVADKDLGNAMSGTNYIPAFTAYTSSSVTETVSFTVTPSFDNCTSGTVVALKINVIPKRLDDKTIKMKGIADQTLCAGATLMDIPLEATHPYPASVGFNNADVTFEWTKVGEEIFTPAKGATGTILPSANPVFAGGVMVSPNAVVKATYRITPVWRNKEGVPTEFTITVLPKPIMQQPHNQLLCNGSMSEEVIFTSNMQASTEFSWDVVDASGNPIASKIGLHQAPSTGNIASFKVINNTSDQVFDIIKVTPRYITNSDQGACTSAPATFTITVNPTPSASSIANVVVTPGTPIPAQPITGFTNDVYTTYYWTNDNTATGLSITSGQNTVPAFTAKNETQTNQVSVITITPVYTRDGISCEGKPIHYAITVLAKPVVTPVDNMTVCAGEPVMIPLFEESDNNAYFTWTSSNPATGLNDNTAPGIKYISFTATNNTAGPISTDVTVTPHVDHNGTISDGTPFSFTITVNPITVITTQPIEPAPVCEGETINLTVVASGADLKYQWFKDGAPLTTAHNATALSQTLVLANMKASDAGEYYVQVTGACGMDESAHVQVMVNLSNIVNQRWNDVLVVNNNFSTNGHYNFVGYQWYKNGQLLVGEIGGSYHETNTINVNDVYTVRLTTAEGKVYYTCGTHFVGVTEPITISVYPNPVSAGGVVTAEATGLSSADLSTLNYVVMNASTGAVISKVKGSSITSVTMPGMAGIYVLRADYASGYKIFKIIVK